LNASEAERLSKLELEKGKLKRLLTGAHLGIYAFESVFDTKR